MSKKEHAWHLPSSTTKHYQWFRNLADFHDLTLAWIKELQIQRLPHLMTRGQDHDVTQNLWMLDSLSETKIDMLLDDTSPDDVLGRLEHTVWTVQAWTLINLFERTPQAERDALNTVLDLTAWKMGRNLGEKRWSGMPVKSRQDLRLLFLAMGDSPFGRNPHGEPFLIKRATDSELVFEFHRCPHQVSFPEVQPVADQLCKLHSQWIRGFVYSLNNGISIEDSTGSPRCSHRWSFLFASSTHEIANEPGALT
ncbi:MAG: hypothetical protein A2428_12415 [Bdellovibrionales bacterium RIFOXYC1_FULL_54_43]|nr:MAG: hypothetical protein A2428_12415 [Bdellovibrionales bacterium RIFOXYC1_FULL_54_43]OFZ80052.1 MAG: hypothetical protein A2603_17185 [Bdellovibrionales bacterium RIFOXYD1_FULL_55_31]